MKLSEYFITRIKLLLCLSGRLEKIILHALFDRDIDFKRVIDKFLINLLIILI
jgi:hypothetical protein